MTAVDVPATATRVGGPVTTCRLVATHREAGEPYLALGSPHAFGARRDVLHAALRTDLSALRIERAGRSVRRIPADEPFPHPESCAPFVAANRLGFLLTPRLPLLFVRSRRGELLPDARTALAYARENADEFADELAVLAEWAPSVLDPDVVARHGDEHPLLFSDLAQPYTFFTEGFLDLPAGCYAESPPGTGLLLGPPVNRPAPLPVQTGLVETDWHTKGLFVVAGFPAFEGRSLLVLPDQPIAQAYFVGHAANDDATVEHHVDDPRGAGAYPDAWRALTGELTDAGRGVRREYPGVASVTLACLHCRASVTRAVDGALPHDHVAAATFLPAYREARRRYAPDRAGADDFLPFTRGALDAPASPDLRGSDDVGPISHPPAHPAPPGDHTKESTYE